MNIQSFSFIPWVSHQTELWATMKCLTKHRLSLKKDGCIIIALKEMSSLVVRMMYQLAHLLVALLLLLTPSWDSIFWSILPLWLWCSNRSPKRAHRRHYSITEKWKISKKNRTDWELQSSDTSRHSTSNCNQEPHLNDELRSPGSLVFTLTNTWEAGVGIR